MLRISAILILFVASACGDDGTTPGVDAGGDEDAGGIACGSTSCAPGEVCCIDCDGTGFCSGPGAVCPGAACPFDAGMPLECGAITCASGEVCCLDCDGTGTCGPPGTACTGAACPPDAGVNDGGSTDAGRSDGGAAGCPEGTCRLNPGGECEEPTGQLGNGCCMCGEDDMCSAFCICASPDTLVQTPTGYVPIADLRVGDLVYSMDEGRRTAVPIVRTRRTEVVDHSVVRARLQSGAVLEISAPHPTADGRTFGELAPGDVLDGVPILDARVVPYAHDATYDILPGSDSGTYWVSGVRIGTTIDH